MKDGTGAERGCLGRRAVLAAAFAALSLLGCKDTEPAETDVETKSSALSLAPFVNLTPDVPDLRIRQNVDVNVLLVGFDDFVNDFLDPQFLLPNNGVARATGSGQVFQSQSFDFHYNFVRAPAWFEDDLFGLLRSVAVPQSPVTIFSGLPPMPITPGQFLYNVCNVDPTYDPTMGCSLDPAAPRVNSRTVTQNYLIDPVFVEKVLTNNLGPLLGIDVTKPTVVAMNWWGRPDYVDHIYMDTYEPDPETHFPRGFLFDNELAGYGGTASYDPESCGDGQCIPHRLWFFDFSAGPMMFDAGNDLVASIPRFIRSDVFPGESNWRYHHPADYLAAPSGTYRPLDEFWLGADVSNLIDAVFLSNIAFAGNLFPPGLTPPRQPHHLVLDVNRWDWDPDHDFAGRLDVPTMIGKMDHLPYDFAARVTDQPETHDGRLGQVWDCSLTSNLFARGDSCYGNRNEGYADADLSTYFNDHFNQFVTGAPDYEVPIFEFMHPLSLQQWYTGRAQTNLFVIDYPTPTHDQQTYVFTSTSSETWDAFYGHGRLLQHEVGHHLGLSHPFNSYVCFGDNCDVFFFFGSGIFYYTYAARYVTGQMTYVFTNNDYSQFELDNLRRYLTYEYVDLSNFIAGKIAASPKAGKVASAVATADNMVGVALAAYQAWDYEAAVEQARAAYSLLVGAADQINVPLLTTDWKLRRRAVGEFRQDVRDRINLNIADSSAEMMGTLTLSGLKGLEGITPVPAQHPAIAFPSASVKLAR